VIFGKIDNLRAKLRAQEKGFFVMAKSENNFWAVGIGIAAIALYCWHNAQQSEQDLSGITELPAEASDNAAAGMSGLGDAQGLANFTCYVTANVRRWNSAQRRWIPIGNLGWLNNQMRPPRRIRAYAVVSGSSNSAIGQIVVRGSVLLQGMSYDNALSYAGREVTNLVARAGYTGARQGTTVGDMQSWGGYGYGVGAW
jgi:hypothetical protein